MSQLANARLEVFARLIAGGYPPVTAARLAGCGVVGAREAARRAARPEVAARIAALARPGTAAEPPPAAPAPDRQTTSQTYWQPMTEAEWMAEYGPMVRARAPADGRP